MKAVLLVPLLLWPSTSCVPVNSLVGAHNSIDVGYLQRALNLSELPEDPKEIAEYYGVSDSGHVVGPMLGNSRSVYQLSREDDHWLLHWHLRALPMRGETEDFGEAEVVSRRKWRGIRTKVLRINFGTEHPTRGIQVRILFDSHSRRDGRAVAHEVHIPPAQLEAFAHATDVNPVPRDAHCGAVGMNWLLIKH